MAESEEILELQNVTKVYRTGEIETPALRGVNLSVSLGEFATVVGPSGCGKTTLLNLIGGLDSPTSGMVRLDGIDLQDCREKELAGIRLKHIGFVFQAYNLFPVLTAMENVEYVMMLQGVPSAERRRRAMDLLQAVGMAEMARKRPVQLSGGQQQRIAVVRAISTGPRLVLADEPTANLDSTTAAQLLDLMEQLNRERGATFLFSTHDPRVVERAGRVIHLRDGRVVEGNSEA